MTKFHRCRRPRQNRSPQSQHRRTQCHRRGRLEKILYSDIYAEKK